MRGEGRPRLDLGRHGRFYVALCAGAIAFAVSLSLGSWALSFVIGGNLFFLVYLILTAAFVVHATSEHLRRRAADADEGLPLILIATGAVVMVSLGAIYLLIARSGQTGPVAALLAVAGLPLGWLTLHTLASFHYANLYYAPRPGDAAAGGLDFPGTEEPGPWDFLYFAFVVGMTAQVSDVVVKTAALRRVVLAHGVASFFYNTVILALAVNAAIAFAGS